MKNINIITKKDKKEVEKLLTNEFGYEYDIELIIEENDIIFSLNHEDSIYTAINIRLFYRTLELFKQYGYEI